MIKTFASKGLVELFSKQKTAKIDLKMHGRILRRLDALNVATRPEDMKIPGFDFQPLNSSPTRYIVRINAAWCLTFEFDGEDACKVNFEQITNLGNPAVREGADMSELAAVSGAGRRPAHPGAILREDVIPALARKKGEIADLLGISRQTLYEILNERQPITPAMAVRIGKLCGNGPGIWLRMQAAYDLWGVEREINVSEIPTLTAA